MLILSKHMKEIEMLVLVSLSQDGTKMQLRIE